MLDNLNNSRGDPYFAKMYADDLLIITKNKSVKRVIDLMEEWADESGQKINKSKCGILPLCQAKSK